MPSEAPNLGWNELQFLSWSEFRHMAPSIVQLEITRLGGMIGRFSEDPDFHNALVWARFELNQFVAGLRQSEREPPDVALAAHLRVAIINIAAMPEHLDVQTKETCKYVLDRLNYLHARIFLTY